MAAQKKIFYVWKKQVDFLPLAFSVSLKGISKDGKNLFVPFSSLFLRKGRKKRKVRTYISYVVCSEKLTSQYGNKVTNK